MAPFQVRNLTLGNIVASGKAKTVPLTGDTVWTPSDLTKVLWQPKGFNGEDANRVAISFTSSAEAEQDLLAFEQWILDAVSKDPKRFLGQDLAPAQVKERFVSAVKISERATRPFVQKCVSQEDRESSAGTKPSAPGSCPMTGQCALWPLASKQRDSGWPTRILGSSWS